MVQAYSPLLCMGALISFFCLSNPVEASPVINWHTNYEEAVTSAKQTSQPLLLFFTGSDWCGWCIKLENEVFNTAEFSQETANGFVFVKLDFPLYKSAPDDISAQNKALQKCYDIRGFPTVVLLDCNQQQIGQTGYRPGGGKLYGQYLMQMVEEYNNYRTKMKQLGHVELSGEELKQLYYKARQLDLQHEVCQILKEGMESKQPTFFAMERYRFLADEGQIHGKEATQLRRFLLEQDPENQQLTHYHVAVIDFEAFSAEMEKENYAAELAVAPLIYYLEKFGRRDQENMWRLHLIISQVFLDKDKLDKALYYAQYSLDTAPIAVRDQIATAIQSIRKRI